MRVCEDFLAQHLWPGNVVGVFRFSSSYPFYTLRRAALHYMGEHFRYTRQPLGYRSQKTKVLLLLPLLHPFCV